MLGLGLLTIVAFRVAPALLSRLERREAQVSS
jgi:hypothetical protein